jgi:hypothetical protein
MGACSFCTTLFGECDQAITGYMPFDNAYEGRMIVQAAEGKFVTERSKLQFSPRHYVWAYVTTPNILGGPPFTSSIYVGNPHAPARTKISFLNIDDIGVHVKWLNEKLLWGTVRWTSTLETDFIFDVDKQAFLYREMTKYDVACTFDL